jgi:DNA-binding transcriptional ArsR family regulator
MLLRNFMTVTKALSDKNRVRMLLALGRGELCVCRITELFELSASTTSKHLSILYQAGLVDTRKDGRWIYYKLPGKDASVEVRKAIAWVSEALKDDPQIADDAKRLQLILNQAAAVLCKSRCQK